MREEGGGREKGGGKTNLHMCNRTTLAQPIRLLNLRPKPLMHRKNQLLTQRRRTTRDHLQRTEIVLLYHGGFSEMEDDRGSDVGVGYLVLLNDGAEFVEVEGGHDDAGEAGEGREVD
jgi:hypothetical protein